MKANRYRSFRVQRGTKSNNTRPGRSSADGIKNVDAEETKTVARVRSDSALASLRRRQDASNGTSGIGQSHDPSNETGTPPHHRNSHSPRLSIGALTFGPRFHLDHKRSDGFFDVFGVLGIPMLVFFLSTSLAVLTQAYIQVFPTEFANYLMDTATFDSGEFWMFPDSEPYPTAIATLLLIVFAGCYLYLAAFMLFFRHHAIARKKSRLSVTASSQTSSMGIVRTSPTSLSKSDSISGFARTGGTFARFPELSATQLFRLVVPAMLWPEKNLKTMVAFPVASLKDIRDSDTSSNVVPVGGGTAAKEKGREKRQRHSMRAIHVHDIYKQFASPTGVYHAYYNVLYDAPKLVLQSITLLAYLRKGFPIALTAFYASLLTFNYLISFYRFQRKRVDNNLIITRLFYLFDLFFAAFAPIVVLGYAYYNFHFDRDVYEVKTETLQHGSFDSLARLYADPVEMSVFRLTFGTMRLTTGSTIFIKCSLLLLSVFKWRKIITYLVQSNHLQQRQLTAHFPKVLKHSSSRRHLLFGIFIFVFFGVIVAVYTTGSIMTSIHHCKQYQEHCVGISYHWIFPDESCPCLVYINRKSDPRTFEEWENPPDVTEELSVVAKMGELRTIQIINRKLPSLPDALRACQKLEQLILLYTKTKVVPDWAQELTYMQYIHIEGDFTSSLTKMPRELFADMKKLTYLHTGIIPHLTEYPSLNGLENLHTLTIAAPHAMRELPTFAQLANLRVLLLVELASIHRLPSLQSLKKIKQIDLIYRSAMCCNGFLTPGKCDLKNYQCLPRPGEPVVECSNESISDDDAALLKDAGRALCPTMTSDLLDGAPTRESTNGACGGVLFRQCQLGNATGMCYNGRMQVVYCDTVGEYEKMRRLQIQRQVGIPCDPSVEAWLGCKHQ